MRSARPPSRAAIARLADKYIAPDGSPVVSGSETVEALRRALKVVGNSLPKGRNGDRARAEFALLARIVRQHYRLDESGASTPRP